MRETREISLSTDTIEILEVSGGDGELYITGLPDLKEIKTRAEILYPVTVEELGGGESQDNLLKDLFLSLEKRGNRAVLVSGFRESFFLFRLFSPGGRRAIHLDVQIPVGIDTNIKDNSGDIYLAGLEGDVIINHGLGSITAKDMAGDIEIEDEDGDILIEDLEGNIKIRDSSGDIGIKKVKGNIEIVDDKGEILIGSVTGNIYITDSTGSISVENVEGDLRIVGAGKGSVRLVDINGRILQNY